MAATRQTSSTAARIARASLRDAGWLVVAVVVLELVLRVVWPQPLHRLLNDVYEASDSGRQFRPGAQSICNNGFGDHEFSINSWRVRDREYGPKEPGELRILVVGDSFSENQALPVDAIYPNVLEAELQRDHAGARISVVNAGMAGWGLWQYKNYLDRMLPEIQPDVVVLSFNMGGDSVRRVRKPRPVPTELVYGLPVRKDRSLSARLTWGVWLANELLESRSHAWILFRRASRLPFVWMRLGREPRMHPMVVDAALAEQTVGPTTELLQMIQARVEGAGAALVLLNVPRTYEALPRKTLERVQLENPDVSRLDVGRPGRLFETVAANLGVAHYDPSVDLAAERERTYFPVFAHWNVSGNRVVAAGLRRTLEDAGLVD